MPSKIININYDFENTSTVKNLAIPVDPSDAVRLQDVPGIAGGISGGVAGNQNLSYFRIAIGLNYQATIIPNNIIESEYTDSIFIITYDGDVY
jgi:hypothetical protein